MTDFPVSSAALAFLLLISPTRAATFNVSTPADMTVQATFAALTANDFTVNATVGEPASINIVTQSGN